MTSKPIPGARHDGEQTTFTLFAPTAAAAKLVLPDLGEERDLIDVGNGYHQLTATDLGPGTRYMFRTCDMSDARPDPASLWQPMGVHGYSVVVDGSLFSRKRPAAPERELRDMILYELHVGTFTPEGTLDAAAKHLSDLVELGINTVELMPLNQCPGQRNWGYDGVYWCAVQSNYGGPDALARFIDAAHELGVSVIVDAVYNHLGPEGNYLPEFAPYLTDKHHTPWGPAINLDDKHSDGVRDLILTSAKTWLVDYGADGLRLDAVHALRDSSATHILQELSAACETWGADVNRTYTLIAECDLNDPRYLDPVSDNGMGMSGQWVDEFHHALRAKLTGDKRSYYSDFGSDETLLKVMRDGYAYTGEYSPHRGRRFGRSSSDVRPGQFVVFGQNHDQVGNRARGERLGEHLSEDLYLCAAATVLWSPFTPMLWMGEEYNEQAPFPYFVDHGDVHILKATREGRIREFEPFLDAGEKVPDPGLKSTFDAAKLSHRREGRVADFYRQALAARQQHFGDRVQRMDAQEARWLATDVLMWRMPLASSGAIVVLVNYSEATYQFASDPGTQKLASDTAACSTKPITDNGLPEHTAGLWIEK